jgi:hypothetical protein
MSDVAGLRKGVVLDVSAVGLEGLRKLFVQAKIRSMNLPNAC